MRLCPKQPSSIGHWDLQETGRFNENPISGVRFYLLKFPERPEIK